MPLLPPCYRHYSYLSVRGRPVAPASGTPVPPVSILMTAPATEGMLQHAVTVSAVESDPVLDNNTAVEETFVRAGADLSIAKSDGGFTAIWNEPFTYTIAVTNHGPEAVAGALVTDIFPPDLIDVEWECVATPGSDCTPSGPGDISDLVDLLTAGTVIYTATGTVLEGTLGPMVNTATVSPPPAVSELFPGNNATEVGTRVVAASSIFADGFESGDLSAWSSSTGSL